MKKSKFVHYICSRFLLLLLNIPLASHANCHAHVFNETKDYWVVFFEPDTNGGGVNYPNPTCSPGSPCEISPGESVEITYTHTGGSIQGHIDVYPDASPSSFTITYTNYATSFPFTADKCPTLKNSHHDDIKGILDLGDEGDMKILGQ